MNKVELLSSKVFQFPLKYDPQTEEVWTCLIFQQLEKPLPVFTFCSFFFIPDLIVYLLS